MGGSSTTTETVNTQSRDPYGRSKPLLDNLIGQSTKISKNPNMFKQSFGADTRQSFGNYRDMATQSQPAYGAGINEITATASGQNLSGNPYYQGALDNSLDRTANLVNQQFSGAGRYGSGAHTGVLTDRLGEQEQAAMAQQWQFERGNQINAANQGVQAGVQGAGLMDMVGQRQDALANHNRMAPYLAAQAGSGLGLPIANMFGTSNSTGTSTQETPANIPGMVLGGITAGAGLMTGNPMMAMGGLGGMAGGVSPATTANTDQTLPWKNGSAPMSGSNGLFW